MLRSEELKFKEEERRILMGLMRLKLRDERLNLKKLKKEKENMKERFVKEIGRSRQYFTLIKKLRNETLKKKNILKKKYKTKIMHLEEERRREVAERWQSRGIPEELVEFTGCKVFDRAKLEDMKPIDVESLVIGDIDLDSDEL